MRSVSHDAGEALNIVEHHPGPIDLLLTDVVMPGMNGIVLAERVRLGWPDTRVLFMSGATRDNLQTRACSQPGMKVVVTPFTGRDLRAKVRELLNQRRSPFARPRPLAGRI
jgi:DNA-binding response OmpR family regulator